MPRAEVPIGQCKAVIHERRLAKRGRREPNNVKDDGTNKPCAFYAQFCGEKNAIYGRKKGAKDRRPRRARRVPPEGGSRGGLPVTELRDRVAQAREQIHLLQDPAERNQMLREMRLMGVEDANERRMMNRERDMEIARASLGNRLGRKRVGKGGILLRSGKEVGDLSPPFSREVPSVGQNLVAPSPSLFSVGTQQAWNYPPARSLPFGLGYFAQ